MSGKLLWTSVAIFLFSQAFSFREAALVSAVLAAIGCILMWLDK